MKRLFLLAALLLAPAAWATTPVPIYCIAATLAPCSSQTQVGNGSQGDIFWKAFGKVNDIGNALSLFAGPPANGDLLIGNGSLYVPATITAGSNVTVTNGPGTITIAATGGSGTPGGTTGQLQYNNAGAFGGFTLGGDCTFSEPNITCTSTNGTAFSALATTVPGTGVTTALGTAVGSAGAFVVNGGALGTPSSGVATNLTGTAAGLNIGGTAAQWGGQALPSLVSGDFLTNNGTSLSWSAAASGITLQTNGTNNLSQTSLNLLNGNGVVFTNTTGGTVTAALSQSYLAVTATPYSVSCTTNANQAVSYQGTAAGTFDIPQATGTCSTGFSFTVENASAYTLTLSPTTSTINGAATLVLPANTGVSVVSDGTNYQTFACTACVGGSANAVVTNPSATQTITAQAATVTPLIVQGAASQSADFFDVENSTGGKLFSINSQGGWFSGGSLGISATYNINLTPPSTLAYEVNNSSDYIAGGGTLKGGGFGVSFIQNATTTGTTADTLTKLTGGSAVIAATTDTSGIIGITAGGSGVSGNANVIIAGGAYCVFDGATTAGDYVQISATTGGDCHDVSATRPTSGEIIGRVLSTNAAAGTYRILLELQNE